MENYRATLRGRVLIAAHRGTAGGNIPCNSMLGYRAALRQGADIIELDVSRSLDGTLYCFHPCMEPRFTTSGKYISQMHDGEVNQLRLVNLDGAATEEPVPLLEEGLRLLRGKCREGFAANHEGKGLDFRMERRKQKCAPGRLP